MQTKSTGPRTRESDGSGHFLFGLLFGGLVGTAAAMWKAVRSGAETRRLIVQKVLGWRDGVRDGILNTRSQIAQAGSELRERAASTVTGARDQVAQTGAEIRSRAEAAVTGAWDQVARQANQLRRQVVGERVEDAVAEGKAIARQRQIELGQDE